MKNIFIKTFFLFLIPILADAQNTKAQDIINAGYNVIVQVLIPIAFALCLLYFFWGVAKYIRSAGSEKDEGKRVMILGIFALFIASSIWGIVYFIRTELGILDIQQVDTELTPNVTHNITYPEIEQ